MNAKMIPIRATPMRLMTVPRPPRDQKTDESYHAGSPNNHGRDVNGTLFLCALIAGIAKVARRAWKDPRDEGKRSSY